jgi:hypothetical protein
MFAAGAAIGSVVTWKVLKNKYELIVQEEIESVKEVFAEHFGNNDVCEDEVQNEPEEDPRQINWDDLEDLEDEEDDSDDEDMNDYERLVNNYTNKEGGAEEVYRAPYIIAPYDFGELDGYKQIELTYYEGDDTLEDESYNIVDDRDELLGPKALTTFGEYEDDAVFVRNERLHADFQILKDYRCYSDVKKIGPDQVDDE